MVERMFRWERRAKSSEELAGQYGGQNDASLPQEVYVLIPEPLECATLCGERGSGVLELKILR